MNEKKLSDMIYMERHKRRETLAISSKKIGCSMIYLSDIENGKRLPMDGEMVGKLCRHFSFDFETVIRAVYAEKCEEIIQRHAGMAV